VGIIIKNKKYKENKMIWFLPLLIPSATDLAIVAGVFILDKYLKKKSLNEKAEILPSLVKLMYSTANIEEITEEESKYIENYITEILKELNDKKFDEVKLSKLRSELKIIISGRDNIKLSDALRTLYETNINEKELISELLKDVINADGKITFEEQQILKRLKIYNEATDKNEAIKRIEEDEKPFLEHYKLEPNSRIKRLKNNLIIINKDYERFVNIADISENEYYIAHPKNSNYLYSLSRLDNVKDDTIDEFINIATDLGALEISYSIERIEDSKSNLKLDVGITTKSVLNKSKIKSNNSFNKDMYNETKHFKELKLAGGHKEDRDLVEKKLLWTKGDIKTKNLIDRMYSKNPLKEWKEDFYLKTIANSLDKVLFNGALQIAKSYKINIDTDIEKQYQSMKEEKISIYIKFAN
jgi:hypothetical protein